VANGRVADEPADWDDGGPNLRERWSRRVLKPVDPTAPHAEVAEPPTVEELEENNRRADDKERLIGLIAAPVAAVIALLVIDADVANDPSELLRDGSINPGYTPVSTYHELLFVLLGLSVLMLATAWYRKRLFLGMATALYGLAIFNLHWWGFGVPFVMVAAWYLVRAYRAQRDLKEATGQTSRWAARDQSARSGPSPNKRYTPPSQHSKRHRRSSSSEEDRPKAS